MFDVIDVVVVAAVVVVVVFFFSFFSISFLLQFSFLLLLWHARHASHWRLISIITRIFHSNSLETEFIRIHCSLVYPLCWFFVRCMQTFCFEIIAKLMKCTFPICTCPKNQCFLVRFANTRKMCTIN